MGLYFRKSVSVGPFRFNLSGSGVGMSVGVRGLRVGTGPRGNYVRVGRGGVYYQQTLPRATHAPQPQAAAPLQTIATASASQITDSSSEQLLSEIRHKRSLLRLTPLAVVAALLLFFIGAGSGSGWLTLLALALGIAAVAGAMYRDTLRKTTVIVYDFDPAVEQAFQLFLQWAHAVGGCRRAWYVAGAAQVRDPKHHAGASALVQRNPTALRTAAPPYIRTNVPVLSIAAGPQTLYFLPDRLLVYDAAGVGAVSYRTLDITVTKQRFVEESAVPADASVVDYTWRYVNRNGGPDLRYANNPRIPICLYDQLHFRTASGFNEVVQLSRAGLGDGFVAAVRHLGSVT
jgi:Protein of unknown function (DUF4236)